jgi:DNA-binding response OmpR family regulator
MARILLVEDEVGLSGAVCEWLSEESHVVDVISNGAEAAKRLASENYDLLLLDWMLPGISGIEVCKTYRSSGGSAPIIMLTAKHSMDCKESGFESGADDYLTKPFQLRELSIRIRALLRRSALNQPELYQIGDITLNTNARTVTKAGVEIHLLPKEFALLEQLMKNAGTVLSVEYLLDAVWGEGTEIVSDTVRSNIKTLRRKIDRAGQPSLILTVHGIGYKFENRLHQ